MRLKLDNNIYYIDNDNFKTIQIRVLFHFKEKQEELALSTLLPNLLNYMDEDYPDEDTFRRAKLEKYILNEFKNVNKDAVVKIEIFGKRKSEMLKNKYDSRTNEGAEITNKNN